MGRGSSRIHPEASAEDCDEGRADDAGELRPTAAGLLSSGASPASGAKDCPGEVHFLHQPMCARGSYGARTNTVLDQHPLPATGVHNDSGASSVHYIVCTSCHHLCPANCANSILWLRSASSFILWMKEFQIFFELLNCLFLTELLSSLQLE